MGEFAYMTKCQKQRRNFANHSLKTLGLKEKKSLSSKTASISKLVAPPGALHVVRQDVMKNNLGVE